MFEFEKEKSKIELDDAMLERTLAVVAKKVLFISKQSSVKIYLKMRSRRERRWWWLCMTYFWFQFQLIGQIEWLNLINSIPLLVAVEGGGGGGGWFYDERTKKSKINYGKKKKKENFAKKTMPLNETSATVAVDSQRHWGCSLVAVEQLNKK